MSSEAKKARDREHSKKRWSAPEYAEFRERENERRRKRYRENRSHENELSRKSYEERKGTPEYKKRRAELAEKRRNNPAEREKLLARRAVTAALNKGLLKRLPCVRCGAKKSTAHHPDYSKPLEVIWLCRLCHAAEHRKGRTA